MFFAQRGAEVREEPAVSMRGISEYAGRNAHGAEKSRHGTSSKVQSRK